MIMATVVKESIGLLHEKIVVTVTPEDYKKNFDDKLKSYAKTANIPGFRKGMVPVGLVKKMYGNGVFQEEVIKTVEQKLFDYLQSEKLDIFAQPLPLEFDAKVIDMNNPSDVSMPFEIGVKPSFEVNTQKINATKYNIEVTSKMIDEEVTRLSTRHGKMLDLDVVSNEKNMLNVALMEVNENGEAIENGIEKTNSFLVSYFSSATAEKLLGKKVEDFIITKLADGFKEQELNSILQDLDLENNDDNKNKFFKITITKIGGIEEAPINEELFKAAFPNLDLSSENDFRTAIENEIKNAFEPQTKNQLHDQIYHALLENTAVDLPENFLKKWLQFGGEKRKTEEEANQEYPSFANSLKWTIIAEKLAKDNDIKVEKEDIKAFAKKQLFGYMNMSSLDESQPWIDDYANRMMNDKKFVEDSFYRIQSEKMFDAVTNQINITDATISFEDFSKMVSEHKH